MHTKCCVVLQRSCAIDDKVSIWDMTRGYMIPIHSKIDRGMRTHVEKQWTGMEEKSSFLYILRTTFSTAT